MIVDDKYVRARKNDFSNRKKDIFNKKIILSMFFIIIDKNEYIIYRPSRGLLAAKLFSLPYRRPLTSSVTTTTLALNFD